MGHVKRGKLRYGAFLPPAGSTEISVILCADCDIEELWNIGDKLVPTSDGRRRTHLAKLLVSDIRELALDVELAPIPHPLHANIVGLPTDKAARLEVAKQLARNASLIERN